MCEASRGRQLRLIRAETDSGRSDGLLNALTCRQPSARLHFLRRRQRRDRTFRAYRVDAIASCSSTFALARVDLSGGETL